MKILPEEFTLEPLEIPERLLSSHERINRIATMAQRHSTKIRTTIMYNMIGEKCHSFYSKRFTKKRRRYRRINKKSKRIKSRKGNLPHTMFDKIIVQLNKFDFSKQARNATYNIDVNGLTNIIPKQKLDYFLMRLFIRLYELKTKQKATLDMTLILIKDLLITQGEEYLVISRYVSIISSLYYYSKKSLERTLYSVFLKALLFEDAKVCKSLELLANQASSLPHHKFFGYFNNTSKGSDFWNRKTVNSSSPTNNPKLQPMSLAQLLLKVSFSERGNVESIIQTPEKLIYSNVNLSIITDIPHLLQQGQSPTKPTQSKQESNRLYRTTQHQNLTESEVTESSIVSLCELPKSSLASKPGQERDCITHPILSLQLDPLNKWQVVFQSIEKCIANNEVPRGVKDIPKDILNPKLPSGSRHDSKPKIQSKNVSSTSTFTKAVIDIGNVSQGKLDNTCLRASSKENRKQEISQRYTQNFRVYQKHNGLPKKEARLRATFYKLKTEAPSFKKLSQRRRSNILDLCKSMTLSCKNIPYDEVLDILTKHILVRKKQEISLFKKGTHIKDATEELHSNDRENSNENALSVNWRNILISSKRTFKKKLRKVNCAQIYYRTESHLERDREKARKRLLR